MGVCPASTCIEFRLHYPKQLTTSLDLQMYTHLAHLYDNAARDVFSAQAAHVAKQEIDRWKFPGAEKVTMADRAALSALDLACGTGLLSWLVAGLGLRVHGVDVSAPMLEVATARRAPLSVASWTTPPTFANADILEPQSTARANIALCFGDVVNHFLELDDVRRLFAATADSLEDGGLFILDATTHSTFSSVLWNSVTDEQYDDGTRVVTEVMFDPVTERAMMRFTSTTTAGVTSVEDLHERYYPTEALVQKLTDAGFGAIETKSWRPFSVVDDNIPLEKTLFVAVKGSA